MTSSSPVHYLSTLSFPDWWLDELRARHPRLSVTQIPATSPKDVPEEVWRRTQILHTGAVFPATEHPAPDLRWIQLDTSGADHLKDTEVWDLPVPLTSIGGISPVPMAEYVLMMLLGLAHRLPRAIEVQHSGTWPSPAERWNTLMPRRLRGATVGVVGYGRIGREIGRLAGEFGMTVLGLKRGSGPRAGEFFGTPADDSPQPAELYTPDALHTFLSRCDYLVVTCPLTDETRGMIDAAALDALKDGAMVVNVSRGGIVDEHALRAGLRSGRIAGAALDVFDEEPLPADHAWWNEPGVILTPHVAGFAPDYEEQTLELVGSNVERFLVGRDLINLVDRSRGY
ncbi:D-2-hydroxyacid dehydrogenase [Streptomyces sp. Je 1-332]|uniref:D-2-hydroxyacid dehydrogenase n=1 Tax=Streptomyces sp. Je 1-332 TaxID=3231270 RepID=UPI00345A75F3